MNEHLRETGRAPRTNLTVDTLSEVDDSRPDGEPPALITKAVLGAVEGEARDVVGVCRIAHETSSSMGIEADHEEECEVVGVPKGLKALVPDLVVGGRVHEDHDEEHEMASDAARLGVMDVQRPLRTNL